MTEVNFAEMSSKQLVEWYNNHVAEDKCIKKFSDRKVAERRCTELFDAIHAYEEPEVTTAPEVEIVTYAEEAPAADNPASRPNMAASLKLDRRIIRVDSEQVWKNAHTMWVENPEWMTSSQQDRLTQQLYKAAKSGQKIVVTVNGIPFQLLNV